MDRKDRAKQFMPFDALKGFREALEEKERVLIPKHELSEEQMQELDQKLGQIEKGDIITVEYFKNGEYIQITGAVAGINTVKKSLKMVETEIRFQDIFDLNGK